MKKLIALIVGSGVCASAWGQGNLIRNGDFEQPASSDTDWVLWGKMGASNPDSVSAYIQSESVSPFTNVFPPSQKALRILDDYMFGTTFMYRGMEQGIGAEVYGINFSFDVRYSADDFYFRGAWNVTFGQFNIPFHYGNISLGDLEYKMDSSVWYQIQGVIDLQNRVAYGSFTPFGQEPISYHSGVIGEMPMNMISHMELSNWDTRDELAGTIYLDNVMVTTIPEPSTIGLLGLGALTLGWCMRLTKAKARSASEAEFRS